MSVGACVAAMILAVGAARADAFIYWGSQLGDIGRANLDGSNAEPSFARASGASGLAVDGAYVYSCNTFGNFTRTKLDGSGPAGVVASGVDTPEGVAVDAGHVYWANGGANFLNRAPGGIPASIGRANLDGSGVVKPYFIASAGIPHGLAVDAGHIYWSNAASGTIGRANLDGSNPQQDFIKGANQPAGIAVDAAHIYWTNAGADAIGRANLDGTAPNQSYITGAGQPYGVAVDAGHIYWSNLGAGSIGRANLDGSSADQRFIVNVGATALAIDALKSPSTKFSFAGKPRVKKGFTVLRIKVAGRGVVKVAQKRVTTHKPALFKPVHVHAARAGTVTLKLKPTKAGRKLLKKNDRFSVKTKVTFTPTGGPSKSATKPITLSRVKYIR